MTATLPDTSWIDRLEHKITGRHLDAPETWETPGALARRLNPKTVQTEALDKIDAALTELISTPDGRLIVVMPPQEGKSTRVAKDFPIWVLKKRPDTRIVNASYGQSLANRTGRAIRNTITSNPMLGLRLAADNGSAAEWQIAGHEGGVLSVGRGAGVTGRPADLLIIDDPLKDRKEADSETIRQDCWDWWTDSLSTRLSPGAQVVLILTRWHDDDLAGRLLAAEDGGDWKVLRIPAEADHDPEKGETDPLDRQPGELLKSARGRTREQWEKIRTRVGPRAWNALYQGRPTSALGTIFKRSKWQYYDVPQWIDREDGSRWVTNFDDLLMSWDLTFKDTEGTDMVVGTVWGRRGADGYLLDRFRGRIDFVETLHQFEVMAARWPQVLMKLVEDKANGPAVISMLRRRGIAGVIPEEPHGSKVARAVAVSPLQESGNLYLPAPAIAPWVEEFVEEAAGFPTAKHDDQVDSMSQALNRLFLEPLITDARPVHAAEYEVIDRRGWYASPV